MNNLAKLSKPRIQGALLRGRLFSLLDERRAHPALWISGPPGAGKTVLASTYLESRKVRTIWFDVDAGEADPATFFYHLRLAAHAARAAHNPGDERADELPLLTPEYLADLPGFARRFFRSFFAAMSARSILVLDNYQEAPADSMFHALVARMLEEIPEHVNVLLISRAEPPAEYARLVVNGVIGQLNFDDLRLTYDETVQIVADVLSANEDVLAALHVQAGGWASGIVLLADRLKRTGTLEAVGHASTMQTVFDYFAGQVLADLPERHREVLIRTAFLPHVTPRLAAAISGDAEAGEVLEEMFKRQLFTYRRGLDEPVYHYHALFNAFLRNEAARTLDASAFERLVRGVADLLVAEGQFEHAIPLYIKLSAWDELVPSILRIAACLAEQGRRETLKELILAVPPARRESEPWLDFWLGTCLAATDLIQARAFHERAHGGFVERGDLVGQVSAAAAVIETHLLEYEFASLKVWVSSLESALAREPQLPTAEIALRVYTACVLGTFYEQPGHPLLAIGVRRIDSLLGEDADITRRVMAGAALLPYCAWKGDFDLALRTFAKIEPLLDSPQLLPVARHWWRVRQGTFYVWSGQYEKVEHVLMEARAIADANNWRSSAGFDSLLSCISAAIHQDSGAARIASRRFGLLRNPGKPGDDLFGHMVEAVKAVAEGDYEAALVAQEAAMAGIERMWFPPKFIAVVNHVQLLLQTGDLERAQSSLAYLQRFATGVNLECCEYEVRWVEAGVALAEGRRERCLELLRECLPFFRRLGVFGYAFRWTPQVLGQLLSLALQADIETEYIRDEIRRQSLAPPSPEVEPWPWPIKVYTLGNFRVLLDGKPLTFNGKTQKRPLELLKALVAMGGRKADFLTIVAILWPDSEDGRKAGEMALSRLRKLLGHADAVLIKNGKLVLNPSLVWTDAEAFEHLTRADVGPADHSTDAARGESRLMAALALYQGNFLADEPHSAWAQHLADRLRARYVRLVLQAGRAAEASSWERAALIYERGLELDNLAEEFYRRLMVCHRERGCVADAARTYRRCRENLSVVLGIAPSAATTTLYNSLHQ